MFDNKKFNVLVRGKHTLLVIAQMDGKRKRDVDKLRLQIANMLSVDAKAVIPNHDYDGLPDGKWFCFRYKGQIPARIRRPSINEDRHLFCAKEAVLNFVDETKPVKKTNTILEAMPGTEDEPIAREDEATPMPTISSDVMATILTRILDRQDEQAKQMEMLAEIIRVAALKGKI